MLWAAAAAAAAAPVAAAVAAAAQRQLGPTTTAMARFTAQQFQRARLNIHMAVCRACPVVASPCPLPTPACTTTIVDPGTAANVLLARDMVDIGAHAHCLQERITNALHHVFKKITELFGLRQVARNCQHVSDNFSRRLARHAFEDGLEDGRR